MRVLTLVSLAACNGNDDTADATCVARVVGTIPIDDAAACAASEVEFWLDDPDSSAVITLRDAQGNDVVGSTARRNGDTVIAFSPNEPLTPGETYEAVLTWCGGTESHTFTTAGWLAPLDAPDVVTNTTYLIDLKSARFLEPAGVGGLLQERLVRKVLLRIGDYDAVVPTTFAMFGAMTEETSDDQDVCLATIDFPNGDLSDPPGFSMGPTDLLMQVQGEDLLVQNLEVDGVFAPDGSSLGCASLRGLIDTRPLVPAVDPTAGPDFLCTLVASYGTSCKPCGDGQPYCLDLTVDQVTGMRVTTAIEPVAQRDCHVDCPASAANPECPL